MSDNGDDSSSLPKAGDVLANIQENDSESNYLQSLLERKFSSEAVQSEADWAHLKGLHDHYLHKGYWSWFLMLLLSGMIIFQSVLLYEVGVGVWNFSAYKWLIPALLVQNLGQVIALAVIVVKSLFR